MSTSLEDMRAELLKCKQYLAHTESATYAAWETLPGRENAHVLAKDGEPAIFVLVGQVIADRISVGPLGNYQTQEEKNFDSSFRIDCKDAKLTFSLRRPTSYTAWTQDYDAAINTIENLQETVAQGAAPRMWFLEKKEGHTSLRFARNLWEKKDFFPEDSEPEHVDEDDDDDFKQRKRNALQKAKVTANYTVPSRLREAFDSVAEDHDIDIPPIFLANGKLVPASQLPVRLPNALVEVMFTLRHYSISDIKRGNSNRGARSTTGRASAPTNTFSATIEQVKILKSKIDPKPNTARKMTTLKKELKIGEKRKERDDDSEEQGSKSDHSRDLETE